MSPACHPRPSPCSKCVSGTPPTSPLAEVPVLWMELGRLSRIYHSLRLRTSEQACTKRTVHSPYAFKSSNVREETWQKRSNGSAAQLLWNGLFDTHDAATLGTCLRWGNHEQRRTEEQRDSGPGSPWVTLGHPTWLMPSAMSSCSLYL